MIFFFQHEFIFQLEIINFILALEQSGDQVEVTSGEAPVRFLLAAAKPLNEKIARYGPFVMNTQEEIMQAFKDYQSGKF
jgi:redox-sensitive bicupin YhaK (pirin superfamily)